MPASAVVDSEALLARVGGDSALLAALARMFVQECPERQAAIRRAIEGHDPPALQRAAHQFKGALALFGAAAAVDAARGLEYLAREGSCDGAALLFESLLVETQGLVEELVELGG
jgi:HPt (histidine-containing phosphotransfer) domain-containing protein